jgi:hypothetical protein
MEASYTEWFHVAALAQTENTFAGENGKEDDVIWLTHPILSSN